MGSQEWSVTECCRMLQMWTALPSTRPWRPLSAWVERHAHPATSALGLDPRARVRVRPAERRATWRGCRNERRERPSAVSSGDDMGMSGFERRGGVEQRCGTEVDQRGTSADERFFTGIRFALPAASACAGAQRTPRRSLLNFARIRLSESAAGRYMHADR